MEVLVGNILNFVTLVICVIALVRIYQVARTVIALNKAALDFFVQCTGQAGSVADSSSPVHTTSSGAGPQDVEIL